MNFQVVYCVTALIWLNLSFGRIAIINQHALIYLFWCQKTHQKSWFHRSILVLLNREKWKSFRYLLSRAFSLGVLEHLWWEMSWKNGEQVENHRSHWKIHHVLSPITKTQPSLMEIILMKGNHICFSHSLGKKQKIWDTTVNIPQLNW